MSDHNFDVDHNYYSHGLRQSQIPDYDVNQEPPPDSLSTLPAYTYRQSQDFHRKRPTVTTDFDHHASNAPDSSSTASAQYDDPHLFYRQYRDSFIRQAGSVYGTLDGTLDGGRSSIEESMTTARTSQRTTPITARHNGYPVSPMSALPVSARWKDRLDNHSSLSPLSDRTPPSAGRANQPSVYLPRGRQSSLQALVNKFNQTQDEVPPAPPSKNSSRSTSANNSPSSNSAPKSFRSRASHETSQLSNGSPKHRLPTRQDSKPTQAQTGRRRYNNASNTPAVKSPRGARTSTTVKTGSLTSQSMVDLSPTSPDSSRKPLFGEVLKADAGPSDPGYGIPVPRRRRGSEGSMHQPNPMFQEEALTVRVSPSSPTAWYMGVTPSLDGIDLNKPVPPRPLGSHRRSRSDIVTSSFAVAPLSNALGKAITILSPPQEQPTPSPSPTAVKRTSQSRIPISTRRISTSDEDNLTNSPVTSSGIGYYAGYRRSQNKNGSTRPTPVHPTPPSPPHSTRSSTPRRSPRHRNHSPPRQSSPRLQAYISEQAPLRSPPLRSSRPRQPVSSASTSASRARAAAVLADQGAAKSREKSQKKPPEIATVDFAARRQRIQQAFTKSMIEAEMEEERKRTSMLHDHPLPFEGRGDVPGSESARSLETVIDRSVSSSQEEESFATPVEEMPKSERELTIDTSSKMNRTMLVLNTEDSPTLGTAKFVGSSIGPQDDSTPEPSSAVTTGTEETFFDNEPQEDTHPAQESQGLSLGLAPPIIGGKANSLCGSDREDAESIQIMLGETPVSARRTGFDSTTENPILDAGERWNVNEQESPPQEHDEHHASLSSMASQSEYLWSPASFMSGNTTVDGDSYTTITKVFDSYHDSNPMSPENMTELQRRIASQSPSLARAGGWDAKKVMQLYLQQQREKGQDPSAVPKPLNVQSSVPKPPMPTVAPADPGRIQDDDLSTATETDNEDRRESTDDGHAVDGLAVPSRVLNLQRASLTNPDDWANTSPSMLDWMTRQVVDTPTDEKDDSVNRQVRGWVKGISELEKSQTGRDDLPVLPDIPRSGGLGININVESPQDMSEEAEPPIPVSTERRASPLRSVQKPARSPIRKPASPSSSMGKSFQASTQSSSIGLSTTPDSPDRSRSEDALPEPPVTAKPLPADPIAIEQQSDGRPSLSSDPSIKSRPVTSELQKRLTRRRHIIEELVNTESSFSQDMTVVVDIYKGTSNVILDSPEDVKALFGNAHDVVAFSTTFLDSLKAAAKSVYLLPKSKRWMSKRDSNATTESANTDDQSSIGGLDLTDEDKDRKTSIGSAFLKNLTEMERVYTDYLKNHDAANQKLQQLQKTEKIQIWLRECQTYASDLTTAWDLDSLLVKPVQRLLKYSLFLKDIMDVTPDNHPDFIPVDTAYREMLSVSHRINEAKKRAELLEQVNGAGRGKKRKDYEGRLAFPKAFGRRSEKLKQQVGLSDMVQDRDYNQVSDKFGSHFFQLQVVMRDVEMYVMDVQSWVNKFNDVILGIEAYVDVGQTTYPELESKWRRFRLSMRELQMTALVDHINAVRKNVIDPMTTLLKLHDGPQRLMDKRKKRVMDFAKYKAVRDRGEKPDKKTTEQGEQFLAINETLKDELPKLFALTGKLVEACLNNFVQLQLQWQSVWKRKLVQAIELHEVPRSFSAIFVDFSGDFRYTEAQVLSLGVCNGSLLADTANLVNLSYLTPGTTISDDNSSRRPSVATDGNRARATSTNTMENPRVRQYSASSALSPMLPSPDLGRPTEGLGLGPHLINSGHQPGTGRRVRASSTASSRSPVTPDIPGGWRNYSNAPAPPPTHSNRPSTSTGRPNETHSLPVPNRGEGQVLDSQSGRMRPDSESSRFMAPRQAPAPNANKHYSQSDRASGVFSSAMPMSDSPRGQSPENDEEHVPKYKILFLAASVYEFNIDRARREAGYPYLTYVAGEIFDVIGEKGELWLAKNQDDDTNQVGWIWNKHFAKLASGQS